MSRHTLLRAVYSKRQLLETMVAFWTDHLNINIDKGDCIYLKPTDDREVIRRHALGKFRDLIRVGDERGDARLPRRQPEPPGQAEGRPQ